MPYTTLKIPTLMFTLSIAAAATLLALPARAAGLLQVPTLSAALALQAASTAKESCQKAGFRVSVSIVDSAGVILVTLRDDGATPHTVQASQRKAYTALSTHMPTSQSVKILSAHPDAAGMQQIEGFLLLSGGVPVKLAESVVGAIGVSGSPGPDTDEKCAAAGLSAIASLLEAK